MPENNQNEFWVPEPSIPLTPPTPPTKVELPQATGVTVIDFEQLKDGSVVIIKIAPEGMQQRIAATQQIAMALRPSRDIIQQKKLAFIVMGVGEGMEVLDEEQMNRLGWHKKEESRIISPY